jgi:hypothetical protein
MHPTLEECLAALPRSTHVLIGDISNKIYSWYVTFIGCPDEVLWALQVPDCSIQGVTMLRGGSGYAALSALIADKLMPSVTCVSISDARGYTPALSTLVTSPHVCVTLLRLSFMREFNDINFNKMRSDLLNPRCRIKKFDCYMIRDEAIVQGNAFVAANKCRHIGNTLIKLMFILPRDVLRHLKDFLV